VKFAIQRFRFAATGRWAVSIRTYSPLVLPFGFLTSIEREITLNQSSLTEAISIAAGGELACALYIFIMQATLLKTRKQRLQPLWQCIVVWFGAGVIRGLFTALNAKLAFGYDLALPNRLIPAAIYTFASMSLVAFFFGSIERKRVEIRALNSLGLFLEHEKSELTKLENERKDQANKILQTELFPQINALQSGINQLLVSSEDQKDAQSLETLYQQSLAVANSLQSQVINSKSSPNKMKELAPNQDTYTYWRALLPRVLSVRITFLLLILGSFSGQFSRNGMEGIKAGFIGAVVITSCIFPLAQIIKRDMKFKPAAYVLGYSGAFALQAIYNVVQPQFGIVLDNPYPPWYSAIKTTYGVYVASIIATMLVYVQGTFKDMIESGAGLQKNIDLLNQQNLVLKQSLAENQFGTLQGKISGVTMALHLMSSMSSIDQKRRNELLSGANALLKETIDSLKISQEASS
jgi:hypothetical protein